MINSNDTIGNLTRDLPVCIAVPQPTVPPLPYNKLKKTHLCEGTKRNHRKAQLISIAGRHQCVTVTPQIYSTDNT